MLEVVLALNVIWFAMGFHAFYIRGKLFAKIVVPNKKHRDNSAYEAIVETGRFMGVQSGSVSAQHSSTV